MITLEDEMVESTKGRGNHDDFAEKVKDGIRAGAIGPIIGLMQQVIMSFHALEADTVNDYLRVTAQLIDWNALEHFEQLILQSKQILIDSGTDKRLMPFRKNAFKVIHAVVAKGMDYPLKVQVIMGL
jgi:hypothetical protein